MKHASSHSVVCDANVLVPRDRGRFGTSVLSPSLQTLLQQEISPHCARSALVVYNVCVYMCPSTDACACTCT